MRLLSSASVVSLVCAADKPIDWMVRAMFDLLIAFVFLTFVASPALVAALPVSKRQERPERHPKGVGFLSASR
jgi:cytochrome c oxidase assembly factor CtaG